MNKPYHERPDWILKSIVYFCDNYTIDGKSLRKYKRGAIKYYNAGLRGNIASSISWDSSPQGWTFWLYLYGLQERRRDLTDNCPAWTDYEKRKIAKMPKPSEEYKDKQE
jgi:hypothetical protein